MPVLLNPKQEAACQARAKGLGPTEAYASAGYKPTSSSATRFFQYPHIAARVAEIIEQRNKIEIMATQSAAEKLGLTKEWVLQRLMFNAERCLRGTPVLDAQGNHTGKYSGTPQGQAANRALELVGREIGMFRAQVEADPGAYDNLSLDQLEERAQVLSERLRLPPPKIVSK